MLMFRRQDRGRVAAGAITVTYRLWKSPKVKAGKLYQTGFGIARVDDVQVVPAALISRHDVAPTGCASVAAIRELAGEHTKTRVTDDTLLTRVQFTFLGNVHAPAKTAPTRTIDEITSKLARLDQKSPRGPWTMSVLQLIGEAPHVPARVLAAQLDWERLDFKAHVRKLKTLGLTISHEVGYQLSDFGMEFLATAQRRGTPPRANPPPPAAGARSARTRRRSR
jgi:hypothetical protein